MPTPVYAVKGIVGPPGPIAASVASPAALGPLDAAGRWPTGTVAYEQTAKAYWTLDRTSTATPDGSTVIAAATTGRWLLWGTQWSTPRALLSATTRAGLSTIADTPLLDGTPAYVTESLHRATWRLDKLSTLTADATTVVATQSGTGRWILESRARGGPVPVTEVGADPTGSVDSSGAFQAAANALAGTGIALYVPAGTYYFTSGFQLPAPGALRIIGVPGATIFRANLAGVGDFDTNSVVILSAPVVGATVQTDATAAQGAMSVQVATLPTGLTTSSTNVPIELGLVAGLNSNGSTYIVRSVSGSGPYTLNLDRALAIAYPSGSYVAVITGQVNDVHIEGITFTGKCGRYIEAYAAMRWKIVDCQFTDASGAYASWYAMHFEGYCVDCHAIRCTFAGVQGVACSGGERCSYEWCRVERATTQAFHWVANVGCDLVHCSTAGCSNSNGDVHMDQGGGGGQNIDCHIDVLALGGNTGVGVYYAQDCRFDVDAHGNSANGVFVNSTAGSGNVVSGDLSGNNIACQVNYGAGVPVFADIDISNSTNQGLYLLGDAIVTRVTSSSGGGPNNTTALITVSNAQGGAPHVEIDDYDLTVTTSGGGAIAATYTASRVRIGKGRINLDGAGVVGITAAAGVVYADGCSFVKSAGASGTCYSLACSAGATLRYSDVSEDSGLSRLMSGYINRASQSTASGDTVIAWPDLQPGEVPTLIPFGSALTAYVKSVTPGTGFTITDTGAHTVDYVVQ